MPSLIEMATPVAELLLEHNHTVAVGESSSGGLISAALLAVPGASAYYVGGAVVYSQAGRRALFTLTDEQRASMRQGGEAYLAVLAQIVKNTFETTWAISELGIAGPGGSSRSDTPPGHTGVAVAGPVENTQILETGHNDREQNMWAFAQAGLALLEQCIRESVD